MMLIEQLGAMGYVLVLTLAAIGAAMGTSSAGLAAVGAWKRCMLENRDAPFVLIAFVGAPLSQVIYGMILMNALKTAPETVAPLVKFTAGALGGLAIGASAWVQGRAGAAAADALAETGKGFGNFMMVLGVIETAALFVMVFLMTSMN